LALPEWVVQAVLAVQPVKIVKLTDGTGSAHTRGIAGSLYRSYMQHRHYRYTYTYTHYTYIIGTTDSITSIGSADHTVQPVRVAKVVQALQAAQAIQVLAVK
jgi:hypothetical protein